MSIWDRFYQEPNRDSGVPNIRVTATIPPVAQYGSYAHHKGIDVKIEPPPGERICELVADEWISDQLDYYDSEVVLGNLETSTGATRGQFSRQNINIREDGFSFRFTPANHPAGMPYAQLATFIEITKEKPICAVDTNHLAAVVKNEWGKGGMESLASSNPTSPPPKGPQSTPPTQPPVPQPVKTEAEQVKDIRGFADNVRQEQLKKIEERVKSATPQDRDRIEREHKATETKHTKETIEDLFGKKASKTDINKRSETPKNVTPQQFEETKSELDEAMLYVQGIVDKSDLNLKGIELDITIADEYSKTGEDGKSLRIGIKDQNPGKFKFPVFTLALHELMHVAVLNSPMVRSLVMDFINKHKTGIVPDGSGAYYELDIPMPSTYCTYFLDQGGKHLFPEEFIPMFFTCLTSDTTQRNDMNDVIRTSTEFAKKYPEYYNVVMEILGINSR